MTGCGIMLDIIQYDDIKKYKRYIPFDNYTSSKLYYDKDVIHKIFFNKDLDLNIILEMVNELKLEELIEIKNLIYKNGIMVGYTMKNYKEYKSLKKFKNRNFALKKQDCIKLVTGFENILKNKLSYVDFHLSNILLNPKNNDIKICDLNGLILKRGKVSEEIGTKNLLILVLAYLYNIDKKHIRNIIIGKEKIENTFINKCNISDKDIDIDFILNIINEIKYENIKHEKKLIISKSKILRDTGYSKFL